VNRDDVSEQNPNGFCNVNFVYTNTWFIYGIMIMFSIKNLYLFLKCTRSAIKFLSSLRFDMRSICYLLWNHMHR